jgi:uncharacterized protein YfaS (alpha-2-macroglobulin family)
VTNLLEDAIEIKPVQAPSKSGETVEGNRLADLPSLPVGEYLLEVKANDPAGHLVVSSLDFTIAEPVAAPAPTPVSWRYQDELHLTLKSEQQKYAPGQTAEILVESPFSGMAWVTVEREKVLRSFVMPFNGNAPMVRVPIEPGDVPNVFVSVTLVRGSDNCPHTVKEPEYRVGCCQLMVEEPESRLAVVVTPGATNYLPAQTVDATVQVSDTAGRPVDGAELALYAVDEGVLSLGAYTTPDPHSFFYEPRMLGVETGVSLPNLLAENPEQQKFGNKGYLGGGGGMERVRKNFLACAFWNALLTTDPDGKVHASFTAPDGLTRYRLIAVANNGSKQFGSSQASFCVSKPLAIEPALPQFASITDHLTARGLVHNRTGTAREVLVALKLDDKAKPLGEGLERCVSVPANGTAIVEFPVELRDVGDAKWIWRARVANTENAGSLTDAAQSVLPVGHIAPVLREVLLNHANEGTTNLLARVNPQLMAGDGTITVNVANTRLNEISEAASQLLHYPYGCAEQTGSSLLPWLVLRESTTLLPVLQRSTNEIQKVVRAGIARLFSMQTASGGLGYWPHAAEPMFWASSYGGLVLALAQRHGFDVPKEEFDSLLKYLSQQLRSSQSDAYGASDTCLALYALAIADKAEPAYQEKLYSVRGTLSSESRAMLALAIAESHGPSEMIAELLGPNPNPRQPAEEHFGCSARTAAIRLLAWIHYRPGDPAVDRLVDDLMREQSGAHWCTTQGNAWGLLALTEYANHVEGKLLPAEGRLEWNGRSLSFSLDVKTNSFVKTFGIKELALANATSLNNLANLTLVNTSNRPLYSSVTIEARPLETPQPRLDRGFSLQRQYERLDDNDQPQNLSNLRVGDRVLVTLRLNVTQTARWVAVDDALPGILEAINPELRTHEARSAEGVSETGTWWPSTYREIRKDRCLSFADWVEPGSYVWRYVARVRAAGTVTAPSAKIEEMYHPERCGLSGSQVISAMAME